jgi:hypothetical protein
MILYESATVVHGRPERFNGVCFNLIDNLMRKKYLQQHIHRRLLCKRFCAFSSKTWLECQLIVRGIYHRMNKPTDFKNISL